GVGDALAVSAGARYACALQKAGAVQCWGAGPLGQLGAGSSPAVSLGPLTVSGISTARQLSAGNQHACAVLANGTVQCWGWGPYGQLGNGSLVPSVATPVSVVGISSAKAVAAGTYHSCALLANGSVQCWGDNTFGQLGDGTGLTHPVPVLVKGISTAV